MASVEPEEVEMLISSPNHAQGNLMMQSEAKFRVLEKKGSLDPRLETPRPAPKVTLKKNWQSQQQQQHSSSCTDVLSLVKTKVVKKYWTGVQDGSKRSTEATASPRQFGQIASDMETDTVLKKGRYHRHDLSCERRGEYRSQQQN